MIIIIGKKINSYSGKIQHKITIAIVDCENSNHPQNYSACIKLLAKVI